MNSDKQEEAAADSHQYQNLGEHHMTDHYFSAHPSSDDRRELIEVSLRSIPVQVETAAGVFSAHRLDTGTQVLLDHVPGSAADQAEGRTVATCLDLGCGWGPISLALAREYPQARVWALDSNERAVELTQANANRNGLTTIAAGTRQDLEDRYGAEWTDASFDLIWSNPPIRIGKDPLHNLLMTYLPRLSSNGYAYLVVQKNLGSDSLLSWLSQELGNGFSVRKYSSAKGYRIIEIHRAAEDQE